MKKLMPFLMGIAFFGAHGNVWGEEVNRVEEIVVAETEEVKALRERKESSVARTVVTKKEMEELGGQTAADVLRRLPRIFFSGPPTTNKDVRMGGLDKEFQNVLINGNRPPGGGEKREFALDRIPVEQIEQIEVLKNPTAAYDADAVAGIVNIILKDPPKTTSINLSGATSFNDMAEKIGNKFTVGFGDKAGALAYSIGGTRNDEYRGKRKDVADSDRNEREEETELVRTLTSSVNLGLSLQAGKNDRLTFRPFYTDQSETKQKEKTLWDLTTGVTKSRNNESEKKEMLLQSYTLEWEHRFGGGSSLKALGSYSVNDEEKEKVAAQFTGAALAFDKNVFETEDKKDTEKVAGLDFKSPLSGPFDTDHLLSLGFKLRDKDRDVRKEVFEVNSAGVTKVTSTPNDSYTVDERITALYLMDEASLTERLVLTPGLRVEITEGKYVTSGGTAGSDDSVDWNPSLHALYKLGMGFQLRGSLARTISRPAFKDKVPTLSVKKDKIEEGNPELKAATSINYEAAIEKYFDNAGVISVGGFYKDIDDVIEKVQTGTEPLSGLPIIKPVNAGSATVEGIEFDFKTHLALLKLPEIMVTGNYTIMTSEVRDPNTGAERRLVDQPNSVANLIIRYDSSRLGLGASIGMNYVGKKTNASDPAKAVKVEQPFTQWDVSLTKSVYKNVKLFASAMNIFNEKREVSQGGRTEREDAGRTYYAGLKYDF